MHNHATLTELKMTTMRLFGLPSLVHRLLTRVRPAPAPMAALCIGCLVAAQPPVFAEGSAPDGASGAGDVEAGTAAAHSDHGSGDTAAAETPRQVVERLHAALLRIMKGGAELGFEGRYETIGPVLEATFDFPTIARIVTGRHWRTASESARNEFLHTFTRLSAATYADRFDDFNGERFRTDGVDDARSGKVVKTHIVKGSGEAVPLDYVLRETRAGWRIINVIADGVSDLSLKRADYTSVIQADGFESLIGRLDAKIQDYATAETSP